MSCRDCAFPENHGHGARLCNWGCEGCAACVTPGMGITRCLTPDCVRKDPHGGPGALHHLARVVDEPAEPTIVGTIRLVCRACQLPVSVRRDGSCLVCVCPTHGVVGDILPLPPGVALEHQRAAIWPAFVPAFVPVPVGHR